MDKLILFIFLSLTVVSCNSGTESSKRQQELLNKEMKKIDWSKVDTYPSVSCCDTIENKELRQVCFYDFIHKELQNRLVSDTLYGNFSNLDTIEILVTIRPDFNIGFEVFKMTDSLKSQRNAIDSLLNIKQRGFPEVFPATKQGIPVTSEFIFPIVLVRP